MPKLVLQTQNHCDEAELLTTVVTYDLCTNPKITSACSKQTASDLLPPLPLTENIFFGPQSVVEHNRLLLL